MSAYINDMTAKARKASRALAILASAVKNRVLADMADEISASRGLIKAANAVDVENAQKSGKTAAFIDRLSLNDKRVDGMTAMLKDVAALKDPVGRVLEKVKRPNGLLIKKVSVPIGVIGMIYESRPNVTADCVALCLKSGNAAILRGGSDAINSNKEIYAALLRAAVKNGLADGSFALIEDTSREVVSDMLKAVGGIDLIMPRGGESLIKQVVEESRVPVIKHYKGVCHVYVDDKADLAMAEEICFNAKVQRPGVCNAMETMLVHKKAAAVFLPVMAKRLASANVALKGCKRAKDILKGYNVQDATENDYTTEYSDLILNIRVVDSVEQAIEHITLYGSNHSDSIVSESKKNAKKFLTEVDSAAVYVNASTRFTDGAEFGKGAEIGISTDKLHARGPMGLEELTSYKYVVIGSGQIRS
jgi:glutamate-5-semialdehyde dehydrogenase